MSRLHLLRAISTVTVLSFGRPPDTFRLCKDCRSVDLWLLGSLSLRICHTAVLWIGGSISMWVYDTVSI